MKLYLTEKEKTELRKKGSLIVERPIRHAPKSSILFGVGNKSIFDKVDYRWVFGDTDRYILEKKNVGRRAVDYPDNDVNINSGSKWWDFNDTINPFNKVGEKVTNGMRHIIHFQIKSIVIDRLENIRINDLATEYFKPILKIEVILK